MMELRCKNIQVNVTTFALTSNSDSSIADDARKQVREFRKFTDDEVKRKVKEKTEQVQNFLKQVEDNYCNAIKANIDHYKNILEKTNQATDPAIYANAKVMHDVYTQMLNNYTRTKSS